MAYTVKNMVVVSAASADEEAAAYADHPNDVVMVIRSDIMDAQTPTPPPTPTYETLTSYVETDPGSMLTVSANSVTATDLIRTVSAYVQKDFGIGHFAGDFQIDFECTVTGIGAAYAGFNAIALTNSASDYHAAYAAGAAEICALIAATSASSVSVYAHELVGGAEYNSAAFTLALNTKYYMRLRRASSVGTSGTLYLDIYSDQARASLLSTLTLALHSAESYRYLDAIQSNNSGNALAISGTIGNIAL